MSIDLRTEKPGGTWTRYFGDHEAKGFSIANNDKSAHVTVDALGIMFIVDRRDIPTAWGATIDVDKLRVELVAAIVRRMSVEILEELFKEVRSQRQSAFWDGERAVRIKIKEARGL